MFKWKWEARATHWSDWRDIATRLGFLDGNHNVRRWDGPEFWRLFAPKGHDDADFENCLCGRDLPEQRIGTA